MKKWLEHNFQFFKTLIIYISFRVKLRLGYNFQIFKTWYFYILLRKKLSYETVEFIEKHHDWKPRTKRLFERIKHINKIK